MRGWDRIRSSRSSRSQSTATVQLGRIQPQAPGHRSVYCNDREANAIAKFPGNSVSTTKYNVLTFLPKGLFEQFRRVANLYFLMISILSSTPISPVSPITNVAPLSIVLFISLVKEAFEDWKRFQNDLAINNTLVDVLQGSKWESVPWKKLQVGDIIRVKQDGIFPADLLFLASTNADGVCYIETSNLDGETNLKIRKALEKTWDYLTPEKATEFAGEVQCEQPNNSLYTFTGNLIIEKQTLPVSPNQLLLRGCSLRNTEYIVGAVIYTGHETKVMMNTMNVPSKRSTLERKLDKLILALFATLFVMCLVGAIGSGIFINREYYYLGLDGKVEDRQFDPSNRFVVMILTMFTLITLFSTIIPISLYVSIEGIKFVQCMKFINQDLNMYHVETNTPALARTSNLNEELGQVEYIFTDKTGTLTRNLMEFFKCSIGGEVYGTGITEIERGSAQRSGVQLEDHKLANAAHEKGFNFEDVRLMLGAWRNEPNPDMCKEFFRCLAICHTVLPEGEESPEKIVYQAASPDEAALVTAAKNFGFFFYRRTPTMIYVRESHAEKMGKVSDVQYEILNVLEFNSTRKRQSVVCRYPDDRLVLYCKGADSVIYERLGEGNDDLKKVTREHLEQFGSAGLRTLCLAYKNLSADAYESWNEKFVNAKSSLRDREKKLDEVAELIEQDLILIGATAIEDKLQEGVPDCIETLSRAGIKIWVLTGDKMETAINIAYACSLINNDMKQFIINSDTDEIREVEEDKGDPVETARFIENSVKTQLKNCLEEAQKVLYTYSGPKLALVIDGKCLMYALDPSLRGMLLNLSMNCSSVVCCRVSPLQKAQVTSLVKKGAKKITLSIGDGANDVSMIQAAHVGVGISGLEGMQAVMASDFAIAQFRFLTDLLLVHGRWSYIRISKVVLYFFYKNFTFTLTQLWFTFQDGFSGQRFYDDWYQAFYNVFFTSLPVLMLGLFDKDVSASLSKKYPQLYMEGLRNVYFNWRMVAVYAFFSVYQSLIFYYFIITSGSSPQTSSGKMFGLWDISTMAFTCVVTTVNVRLLLSCNIITRWHHISVWGSILAWFIFIFLYSGITTKYDRQENVFWSIYILMSTSFFYLAILVVPLVALAGDFLYQGVQRWFYPYDYQIIQEMHRDEPDDNRNSRLLEVESRLTPEQARTYAIAQLPQQRSKHTGFAFDSPGYESFFAAQVGVYAPQKAWDVARRASVKRSRSKKPQKS